MELSKQQMAQMARDAGKIEEQARDAGRAVSGAAVPVLPGFRLHGVIPEIQQTWREQAHQAAEDWKRFGGGVAWTSLLMQDTDELVAFRLHTP